MPLLVSCLPLIALAVFICDQFKRSFAESFPVSVFSAILILYVFGLFNLLRIGVSVVWFAGFACAILCFFRYWQGWTRDKIRPSLGIPPAFVAFALLAVCSAVFTKNRALVVWDEFSHWALVVKNMFYLDAFGTSEGSTVVFRSYPPSIALFEYYFVRSAGRFTEGALFFSKDVLSFALFMPFFRKCDWKNCKSFFLLCAIAFCIPLVEYPYYYSTVIVDGTLGLLFSYSLATYCLSSERDLFLFSSLALALFVLTDAKPAGLGLALFTVVIILADLLIFNRKAAPSPASASKKSLIGASLPVAAVLFGKCSWLLHCRLTSTLDYWRAPSISLQGLVQLVRDVRPYQKQTLFNFYNRLFELGDSYYAIKLSPILWISAVLALAIGCRYLLKGDAQEQKRFSVCVGGLTVFYFAWLGSMLFLYLFIFNPVEAQQLASFNRYVSTYQMGAFVFIIMMLAQSLQSTQRRRVSAAGLALLLCAMSFCFSYQDVAGATVLSMRTSRLSREKRASYQLSPDVARALHPETDSVCYISQERKVEGQEYSGYAYYMARYDLTPIPVGYIKSWSYGTGPKFAGDCWTTALSGQEFASQLLHSTYTHVYAGRTDAYFLSNFGDIFGGAENICENTLYDITRTDMGVTLTAVVP